MTESFLSVDGENIFETVIERSRFIADAFNVYTDEEAENKLSAISKKHSAATHNCFAYILGTNDNIMRFSDDKEPSKTAGLPILDVIKGRKLFNTMVVVTRYFGGIKLGTGGLIRAYGDSAAAVLDKSNIKQFINSAMFEVKTDYSFYNSLERLFSAEKSEIIETKYNDIIIVSAVCPLSDFEKIKLKINDITSGKAEIITLCTKFYPYKI